MKREMHAGEMRCTRNWDPCMWGMVHFVGAFRLLIDNKGSPSFVDRGQTTLALALHCAVPDIKCRVKVILVSLCGRPNVYLGFRSSGNSDCYEALAGS